MYLIVEHNLVTQKWWPHPELMMHLFCHVHDFVKIFKPRIHFLALHLFNYPSPTPGGQLCMRNRKFMKQY